MSEFINVLRSRRSVSKLKKKKQLDYEMVVSKIKEAVQNSPSAFNSQSASIVVLFDEKHDAFWDEVLQEILPFVAKEKQQASINKIQAFKNGDGTIVFLEDTSVLDELKDKFPLYQDNVMLWSDQGQGFVQYAVWLMLTHLGLHASLQHYNPLIDEYFYQHVGIDRKYKIIAQMPFGEADQQIEPRKSKDINERVKKI